MYGMCVLIQCSSNMLEVNENIRSVSRFQENRKGTKTNNVKNENIKNKNDRKLLLLDHSSSKKITHSYDPPSECNFAYGLGACDLSSSKLLLKKGEAGIFISSKNLRDSFLRHCWWNMAEQRVDRTPVRWKGIQAVVEGNSSVKMLFN
jgi:hypothetical protein